MTDQPNSHTWRADEHGVALHVPDPTGMTNGATVLIPEWEVTRMYQAQRAAQLGADSTGEL